MLTSSCAAVYGDNADLNTSPNGVFTEAIWNNSSSLVLGDACRTFDERVVKALQVDTTRLATNVENALLSVTALNPVLGYDAVARITRLALQEGITPRAAALSLGLIDADQYDRIVDPARLAGVWNASADAGSI
ncbi:hypothetical protein [Paraburkholderia sp. JHI869]|uniref:hypothetical protein n=1 Tax=Paraburkholderia sp. JHI869 TaxID=3112959 RepID=UPI00317BF4FF